ncbi:MAG TPA: nicotinate-nucleotide adenylyltransferase [Spirochaetota bacterium]|nr:nicotinate-nucleotide adenylyltransferase [Spirochaetota bacterium]HOD14663.1 nicotinate-nucleotide adenylyltransferase [Spirochaetota bacterium]HPG51941.1 nicotinate-nucleotide adenylyltransferase [Spirochaetota bacterium]HPN11380.1 nicotinate-nucleotide adenylyltransferase [Spirochaetota bacterium]HQL81374.1 nicotinate-nucleotide adenylyltransferase [Spirochaetota bacterium]
MKLGIFGGTFNPIHYGHLINAEIIRSDYNLDRIILVPARQPVHKSLDGNVQAEERYAMAALAVGGAKETEVSRIEIDREEPSYTITTVHGLLELYPGSELSLVIGMDSLAELDGWRESDHLLEHVSVIVMRRPGPGIAPGAAPATGRIHYAENPLIDISSTYIRDRIRAGKSVRYLLPDAVIDYIHRKGLYRN